MKRVNCPHQTFPLYGIQHLLHLNHEIEDQPSLRDFNNLVRQSVTPHWEDLGVQLRITVEKLDEIKANFPQNVTRCTLEMFKYWCQTYPNKATWETLLEALTSPSLQMNELAQRIQQNLLPGI